MRQFFRRFITASVCITPVLITCIHAQDSVPSITQTPEAVVVDWKSPELIVPDGPRINDTTPRTAKLLADSLADKATVPFRRAELVIDLGKTELPEASPAIESAMKDADANVRAAAAQSAGLSGRTELSEPLAKLADDVEPIVRAEAVKAHAKLNAGRTQASPVVLKALNDASAQVKLAGLVSVATADEADAVAAGLGALTPRLQTPAMEALGRAGSKKNAGSVAELLKGDPGQQGGAIKALSAMNAERYGPDVVELLKSNHPAVRRAATTALGSLIDADQAGPLLVAGLDDPDPSVRAAAAVIAPVKAEAVVNRLVELLSDPYLPVHDAALSALKRPENDATKSEIIAQAVKLLDAPAARRRQDGSSLLGKFASNAGLDKQIAMLATKTPTDAIDDQVMIETVRALGLIGDKRATDTVFALAKRGAAVATSKDGVAGEGLAGASASDAIVASARLGDRRILEPGKKIMSANPEFTPAEPRAASAWAVGELGEPADGSMISLLGKLYNSPEDSDDTKFEAVKSLGRLKATGGKGAIESARTEGAGPRLRWIGAWAAWRLTGQASDYLPPQTKWKARVAIEDTQGQ